MKKDIVIIGAGPAGIFTAIEMLKKGSKQNILIVRRVRRWRTGTAPRARPSSVSTASPTATSLPASPVREHFPTGSCP